MSVQTLHNLDFLSKLPIYTSNYFNVLVQFMQSFPIHFFFWVKDR